MHIEKREDPNPDIGYEVRDINAPAIWKSTIYFLGFALMSAILGALVFWLMNPGLNTVNERAVASERSTLGTKVPVVQSNIEAKTHIMLMRQAEEKRLFGAPVQNKNGSFAIPIAAAMGMVVESGAKTPAKDVAITPPPQAPKEQQPAPPHSPSPSPNTLTPNTGGTQSSN